MFVGNALESTQSPRSQFALAYPPHLTQNDVTGSVLVSLSSTSQVAPNYWVNPTNRVNYRVSVQTPPYLRRSISP